MRHRILLPALCALAVPAGAPSGAGAVTTYRASVQGVLESTGSVTDARCSPWTEPVPAPVADGPREPDFGPAPEPVVESRTGRASVVARFRTTRPATIFVQRLRGDYPAVALSDGHRPIRAAATVVTRSTLEDATTPLGCSGSRPPRLACGTRDITFGIAMGTDGRGLSPDLSATAHTLTDGGFCPLTDGMTGFPRITGGTGSAVVPAARLLGARRLTLHGGRTGHERIRRSGVSGSGGYRLQYTITLTRVR